MTDQRRDVCPDCGCQRLELVVAGGRFYCYSCGVASAGPNYEPSVGVQLTLGEAASG